MSARRARKPNELPYIPLGPFQWRIPGVHYRVEYVEFFQGLILGATALSSIPYLTDYLGLPYELAWSCVILEVALYMLHGWLGDPVVPGWITPTLPFTLAFISGFEKGPQRIQAMIAVQLLVAFIFLFMGVTKLADKFVRSVPTSVKGGNPSRCADYRYSGTVGRRQPTADGSGSDAGRNSAFGILKFLTLLREEERKI